MKAAIFTSSDGVALEAPVVALRLFQHLPEGALPFAGLFVLLLDPEGHLHHAAWDVPVTPEGLHGLVVIARAGRLIEKRTPRIFVLADELNLLEGVLWLPLLNLLPDLADGGLGSHGDRKHAEGGEDLDLRHVILIALRNLCSALLDQAALLIPDLAVRGSVLSEDDLLALLLSHCCWQRLQGTMEVLAASVGLSLSQNGYGFE
eukprot:UN2522